VNAEPKSRSNKANTNPLRHMMPAILPTLSNLVGYCRRMTALQMFASHVSAKIAMKTLTRIHNKDRKGPCCTN
jgi:hypothetical protein